MTRNISFFSAFRRRINQRAMGLGGGADNVMSKVIFNGHNAEEFMSKFHHICCSYQVDRIFYTDYGRERPGAGPERLVWDQLDSKAFRVLEKHLAQDIFSSIRDQPDMSARQIFDVLTETHLTGTIRSISQIEQEMEMVRMADDATLMSHFSIMCRYFRELGMHGQPLTDRQKITKTMCKLNLEWYKLANAWVVTQPEELTFDQFRKRLMRMDMDGRTFAEESSSQAAFAAASNQNFQKANFHHSVGGRTNNNNQSGRARGRAGRGGSGKGVSNHVTTAATSGKRCYLPLLREIRTSQERLQDALH
jgi:hypothetical protein